MNGLRHCEKFPFQKFCGNLLLQRADCRENSASLRILAVTSTDINRNQVLRKKHIHLRQYSVLGDKMIQEICIKASVIILSVLQSQTKIKNGVVCNPTKYFDTIYRLQSRVLQISAKHQFDSEFSFNKNITTQTSEEKKALEDFEIWFEAQNMGSINLSYLYELMLLLEFPVRDGKITSDGENLNSIGSFYTPTELADKIVNLTLDNYIHINAGIKGFSASSKTEDQVLLVTELLLNSTFADYSCGTGSFLMAILRYCKSFLRISANDLKLIALNFNTIEADSLSLEIAKLQVLEAIDDFSLYSKLSKKFVHGNPLIAPSNEYPNYDFCHEFYYHNSLAMESNQIPKCDVVVGNPPWGTVGFDLQHYFLLLCPNLNAIANASDLEIAIEKLSKTHPNLYKWLLLHDGAIDLACEEIYNDERFEHSTMGGLHTNVLFTELCNEMCTERGTVGLILKGSTLSDSINKRLVNYLASQKRIQARFNFLNTNNIFNIEQKEEFSILILGPNGSEEFSSQTRLTHLGQLDPNR